MRWRRGKDEGDDPMAGPPPSADDRVDDPAGTPPPPDPASREEEPTEVLPGSAPPPDAAARVEEPGPAKVLPPPDATARVEGPASVDAPPPQPGALAAPPGAGAGLPGHCPQCGTPVQPGQEICIVCGTRLARAYDKPRGSRLPIVLAVLGLLLIGAAATFGAIELLSGEDEKDASDAASKPVNLTPPVAGPTGPSGPSGPSGPAGPSGTTGPTIPPATAESPPGTDGLPDEPSSPSPSSGGAPAEWPAGKTAYTVVLQSATSRSAADAKARQAVRRGLPAGVLRSSDYSTLRPGYWVVFAGQFGSSEAATKAADRYAEQGFGGGYPRQVKPK